jgi:molecular chaperone GrpE
VSGKGNGEDAVAVPVRAEAEPGREDAAAPDAALEPSEGRPEEPSAGAEPEDEVTTLRRERDELRDTLLRRRADFENFRRRVERDRAQAALDAEASILDSLGVVAIAPLGERFDPALHQAIVHEPAPGFEAGTVAEVFRKGYSYKDRLLRPAIVKVASADGGDAGR